ncbi:Calcineurin-like metallo-phosphoesterase superfamily protein [Hirschfeldia incana]|nr:Calcineurin-like metallo-phosphoesterase superfamily protein [Hirschfeldia incana]KAJ0251783.1 Calcineurin-like metallo-phosphoesterase superfamily protein [Hirschfeldia incana]
MKQSSWGCTIFIQLSLCLIVYVSLHLGHQSLSASNGGDNAGALDLHFISVSGGFRPLHRQTRLLRLMERVAETYKAKFVVRTSEHGGEDLLLLNDTRVSSSLKLPWYTTKNGSGSFREHIELPFGGSLDVVFVDTGSLQKEMMNGALNGSMIGQLKELAKILKAADGDWRIVAGSDPLFTYTLSNGSEEAKRVARTFQQITIKYGVNMYISEKGCTSGANNSSFTCIMVPNTSENQGSTNDSKREIEDGFLLHRVSFSEFVTYTINLSGQVIDTRIIKQKGKESI